MATKEDGPDKKMDVLVCLSAGDVLLLYDARESEANMPRRAITLEERRKRKRDYAHARRLKKTLEVYSECQQLYAHDPTVRLVDDEQRDPASPDCQQAELGSQSPNPQLHPMSSESKPI